MNMTLAYLRGRRAWLVENFSVWGTDSDAEFRLAVAETIGSDQRIGFWRVTLGGQTQDVAFATLTDSKGNHLPEQIQKPSVLVVPRGRRAAFVKTINGESGFGIARSDDEAGVVSVDLLIFEMGA